jgi:hypothetical protein
MGPAQLQHAPRDFYCNRCSRNRWSTGSSLFRRHYGGAGARARLFCSCRSPLGAVRASSPLAWRHAQVSGSACGFEAANRLKPMAQPLLTRLPRRLAADWPVASHTAALLKPCPPPTNIDSGAANPLRDQADGTCGRLGREDAGLVLACNVH